MNVKDLDLKVVKTVAEAAYAAGNEAERIGSVGGCGRVYVELGPLRKNAKVVSVLSSAGFKMTERPYSSGVRIYVGYDNASGFEWNRGELIAKAFKAAGVDAYVSGDSD